ncbi:MAG TPA: ATP-binding cassette domain-containing protein, partial [Sphingomonas sp.]
MKAAFRGKLGGFDLDVAFAVPDAGVTALAGPSGSGKTTVLRCLAGLERLAGELIVGEETWQDERTFLPPGKRRIGYVFQGGALLPHLSVRGNLVYAAKRAPPGPFGFDD